MATPLFFSTFEVTRQAFHRTALAFAFVNFKSIVPGHTCGPADPANYYF
jgi:bis(5'-adenosyl)-triphosphatase